MRNQCPTVFATSLVKTQFQWIPILFSVGIGIGFILIAYTLAV